MFTSNSKREFEPCDQGSALLVVYCPISSFTEFFIHKNCFELFSSAHNLF